MSLPNLLVLIPYSQGIMIYRRAQAEQLHHTESSPVELAVLEALAQLPAPRLVAYLGTGPHRLLGQMLLRETDLCLIPTAWMKHIPLHQPASRARFAVQLIEAFLSEPIRLLGNKTTERTGG